jgi:hypothetical protein
VRKTIEASVWLCTVVFVNTLFLWEGHNEQESDGGPTHSFGNILQQSLYIGYRHTDIHVKRFELNNMGLFDVYDVGRFTSNLQQIFG